MMTAIGQDGVPIRSAHRNSCGAQVVCSPIGARPLDAATQCEALSPDDWTMDGQSRNAACLGEAQSCFS